MQRTRLDKFLKKQLSKSKRDIQLMLGQGRVMVDDVINNDAATQLTKFSKVAVDDKCLPHEVAHYVMLNKPIGVVCATQDNIHKTVVDLLDLEYSSSLHIVGRLDLNTSGLVLLTNDSEWSERLTLPEKKVAKIYQVTLKNPLNVEYIEAFAKGMYFAYEDITTKPVQLEMLSDRQAQLCLIEGRYHQIKRMFGRFRNPVMALHRSHIGALELDPSLAPGDSRELSKVEASDIFKRNF